MPCRVCSSHASRNSPPRSTRPAARSAASDSNGSGLSPRSSLRTLGTRRTTLCVAAGAAKSHAAASPAAAASLPAAVATSPAPAAWSAASPAAAAAAAAAATLHRTAATSLRRA
eukprot:scaffold41218_cov58-Phaeocystis_antarctica.AAC.6